MKIVQWTVAVVLIVLAGPMLFLLSCEAPPSGDAGGETAAGTDGEAAAGRDPARAPRQPPVTLNWIALEQVSPIVGGDGTLGEALGLEMPGGAFHEVIARGEKVPVSGSFTLATAVPNQREMTVHVLRGNADRAEESNSLGWYRIEEIPPGPEKETFITLVLRVADNAVVGAAIMPRERITLRMVPSAPPPGR